MKIIACLKLFIFALICLAVIPTQAIILLLTDGPAMYIVPKFWHRCVCTIFRIRVNVSGENIHTQSQTLFVSNHISYLDIPVVGQTLNASFIAKQDVEGWPVFGLLAKLQRTIFIKRTREGLPEAQDKIKNALLKDKSLILFPEGTSTQGVSVLPFKSTLFQLALAPEIEASLMIQPFTVSVLKLNGKTPKDQSDLDYYAWHSDMTLPPHLWALAQQKSIDVAVKFHKAMPVTSFDGRKDMAMRTHKLVSDSLEIPFDIAA